MDREERFLIMLSYLHYHDVLNEYEEEEMLSKMWNIPSTIGNSFLWARTTQGFDYWRTLNNEFKSIISE